MGDFKFDSEEVFSTFQNFPSCSVVQILKFEERCSYVLSTPECKEKKFYFNYLRLLYCGFNPHSNLAEAICVMALLSICLLMFLILATTADTFFCPALKVISAAVGLNEHLAGVTILAFGNGSPDLFTSLAGVHDASRLLFSDLFGAAIYVYTFVGGVICILHPFKLQANMFLRDVCFLLFGIIYIDYAIVSDGCVTMTESICIISIYFVYFVIIFLDQILLKRHIKKANRSKLDALRSEAEIDIVSRTSRLSINIDLTRKVSYNAVANKNELLFQQLVEALNPIDMTEFRNAGYCNKFIMLCNIPIRFILTLVIPIVDYELDRHGWTKLLNCVQMNIMPVLVCLVICPDKYLFDVPIFAYTFIGTVPASIAVFMTTRTDLPPRFHFLLAIYSVCGSILIIYSCASETVQILYILGIVSNSSNSFLGCTLLAWGNSIGDLVSNIALSRQGYQRMGFAACIGGPFFNSILAMGGTFLYRSIKSPTHSTVVNQGVMGENCMIFLVCALSAGLVWSISTDFRARRSVGVFNIIIYGIFFMYAIFGEAEIIQTYAPSETTGTLSSSS